MNISKSTTLCQKEIEEFTLSSSYNKVEGICFDAIFSKRVGLVSEKDRIIDSLILHDIPFEKLYKNTFENIFKKRIEIFDYSILSCSYYVFIY